MSYREPLYARYVSTHTRNLYGRSSLDAIKKQFPAWKAYFGKYLPCDRSLKILDAGCGNGGFVWFLTTLGFENCVGVDASEEQIAEARDLGIQKVYHEDLALHLANHIDSYDLIFMKDILEHFHKEEVVSVLRLAHRSLRSTGALIIQTINGESPMSGRLRWGDFTHEVSFTRSSLNQVLFCTGFKRIEYSENGPVIHGLRSLIRWLLWQGFKCIFRLHLMAESGCSDAIFTSTITVMAKK